MQREPDGGKAEPQLRMAYAYDTADNMTDSTKFNLTAAVRDTFADGNYTASPAWTVSAGTWSAATYQLVPTPSSTDSVISTANTAGVSEIRMDYYQPPSVGLADSFTLYLRYGDANNYLALQWGIGCLFLNERVAGVETQLGAWVATEGGNAWYTLYALLRNDSVTLYHGPQGKGLKLFTWRLPSYGATTTAQLRLSAKGLNGFKFDNVNVHTRTSDAAMSTTFSYNDANQLTSSVTNGITTTYAYDPWGRLSTRTAGSYSATYGWGFGDKLKQVTSSFPGESASVAYNYDGLGKRRNKQVNGGPAMTWWRWGLGWETLAQYNDSDSDWDIEGFAQFNVLRGMMFPLAEATVPTGQTPANATYSYLALDRLSNSRAIFNNTKAQTSSMEFYPYGQRLSTSGTLPYNQFTAKPYDMEDCLYYFPARYYSPTMSRWTAADPAGTMDGPNVYYYVKCRPNAETDMLGLETCGTNKVCCDLAGRYVSFCCGLTGAKLWGCKIFVDAGCKGLLGCQSCCDKDLDHCKDCCVLNISSVQEQFECIRSCIGAHEACRLECVGKS